MCGERKGKPRFTFTNITYSDAPGGTGFMVSCSGPTRCVAARKNSYDINSLCPDCPLRPSNQSRLENEE